MTSIQALIIDSGRNLIMSRGYNGFSYADVSEVIGIRKASIHHHFPTKADLACAVVAQSRAIIKVQSNILAAGEAEPDEQLLGYVTYWEQCIVDGTAPFCIAAMLASELPTLPPVLATEVRAHFSDLAGWLENVMERGAELGRFKLAASARVEADGFMSTVYGAMLTARAYGQAAAFREIVQAALIRLSASGA
jgi:TetR/AcrR family transcriptional regulator, transcriptional repressor for nem operon